MGSPSLHAVLSARRDEVIVRWKAKVDSGAAAGTPTIELVDQVPLFVSEILATLAVDGTEEKPPPVADDSPVAAEHGNQRLRLGFSIDAVVREYGALRDALVETARDAGVSMTAQETQSIFNSIIGGIANAVSEYARQREAELARQHNEHFAFIAHELRNPLSSAVLAVTQLRAKGQLPQEARASGVLERSLRQMHELIDHALGVARVASGIALRKAPVQLAALLEEVRLAVLSDVEDKEMTLRVQVAEGVEASIDARLMRSALTNLVGNAVKYSRRESTIELRAELAAGQLHIEIQDACGGFSPAEVEKAFVPFVRLDTTQPGFGLGLAIAKQAIDAHGGSVRVQDQPGRGCTFVIDIPTPA